MRPKHLISRRTAACGLLALLAVHGCVPVLPPASDAAALRAAKRMIVLPLADGPAGPRAQRSGSAMRSAIMPQLLNMPGLDVVNVSPAQLQKKFDELGYALEDRYDPVVAADVAKALGADTVITGEITHYDIQKEKGETVIVIVGSGGTDTLHWVSANIRVIRADDARIIYTGGGTASSPTGFTPAAEAVCKRAFHSMRSFLEYERKRKR